MNRNSRPQWEVFAVTVKGSEFTNLYATKAEAEVCMDLLLGNPPRHEIPDLFGWSMPPGADIIHVEIRHLDHSN